MSKKIEKRCYKPRVNRNTKIATTKNTAGFCMTQMYVMNKYKLTNILIGGSAG